MRLDGVIALQVAEQESLVKLKDERDTEFVKRIVSAYLEIKAGTRGRLRDKALELFRADGGVGTMPRKCDYEKAKLLLAWEGL